MDEKAINGNLLVQTIILNMNLVSKIVIQSLCIITIVNGLQLRTHAFVEEMTQEDPEILDFFHTYQAILK